MPKQKPKPQARGLAKGLRTERKACKFTMVEVADKLGWSESTLSRIETGLRPVSSDEVSALLAIYQVIGERRRVLMEMARDLDRPVWLETRYADVPEQAKTLAQYESEAKQITVATLSVIPGLLQTEAYAKALMTSGGVPPAAVGPRVELRLERQKILDRKAAPTLVTYVDEAALHRRIGGAKVMADQLGHLAKMAARPRIEVRVIPFGKGSHSAIDGPFVLLEFKESRAVVHIEQKLPLFFDDAVDVKPYLETAARLDLEALDDLQTLQVIEDLAASFR